MNRILRMGMVLIFEWSDQPVAARVKEMKTVRVPFGAPRNGRTFLRVNGGQGGGRERPDLTFQRREDGRSCGRWR